ncbi:MAG: hypothetical protein ABMB14_06110 [Myxococcota bacterium]
MIDDRREICDTIEALRKELDDLVVRGLRTAGPQDLAALDAMTAELRRVGASHLTDRLDRLLAAIRADDRGAAGALLGVQATLRVFERVLTLDTVAGLLDQLAGDDGDDGDDPDSDDPDRDHDEGEEP